MAGGFFLVGLIARWPLIARGETLLHSDEAIVGLMAQDIADWRRFPLFFYGQRYMGALEAYVIAAALPLFNDPVTALRFGPACFFAALVSIQYLMLTRWFGRRGGLMGAVVLLAAAPMFAQWSVSARGGYIEIMLWGCGLLWAYAEWFLPAKTNDNPLGAVGRETVEPPVPDSQPLMSAPPLVRHRFLLGALIGSGLWINPSIALFVVPIAAHALLNRPLGMLLATPNFGRWFKRAAGLTGRTTLPVAAILAVLALNATWAVWVGDRKVQKMLLLGLVPPPIAAGLLVVAFSAVTFVVVRKTNLAPRIRALGRANGAFILGILIGEAPAVLYVAQAAVSSRALEPALPLGLRPIWLTGETMIYLIQGLPLLFGADPRSFLQLISVGRDTVTTPLGPAMSQVLPIANWLVVGAVAVTGAALVASQRQGLSKLLRLEPARHSPVMLLLLGALGMLGLYVLGGCTFDFTTIRYLVPIWVFVPGLFAAVFANRGIPFVARLAPICACAAWATGQIAMIGQLGHPHPLRPLATALTARGVDPAIAEPLDAHLLSYLTRQECRTAEFESFWPRLKHFRPLVDAGGTTDYIVETQQVDRVQDWILGRWPGRPPPETERFLWPRLRRALIRNPDLLISREPLVDGYELIRLRCPLPERKPPS